MDNNTNTSQADPVVSNVQPASITPTQEVVPPPAPTTSSAKVLEGVPYASLTSRSLAGLIDGLIIGAVSMLFNAPSISSQFISFSSTSYTNLSNSGVTQITTSSNPLFSVLSLIGTLFGIIYPIYFIGKNGATPGKKIMKIKVIDKESGEAPGYLKAFLREFVGKLISSIFLSLGYFWAIWDKEKQGWHDKIAGTIVVKNTLT